MVDKKNTQDDTGSTSEGTQVRKMYRSNTDKMISGVCGGVAEYAGLESNVVRIVWTLSAFLGGIGLCAYVLAWIIIPENPDSTVASGKKSGAPRNSTLIWGLVLIFVGAILLADRIDLFPHLHLFRNIIRGDVLKSLLWICLILAGIYYLINARKNESSSSSEISGGTDMQKRLFRSVSDKMVAGVCGGLADYFQMDPSIVRIGFALVTLASGGFLGIVAYIVMLVVIPEETVQASGPPAAKTGSGKPAKSKK